MANLPDGKLDEPADLLTIGTETAHWQIKDFSVVLRQQITATARANRLPIADWLHHYFQRHGIDGQHFDVPPPAPPELEAPRPRGPAAPGVAEQIDILVTAACRLAGTKGVNQAVRRAANVAIHNRLALSDQAPPVPALAAPKETSP
jgi:hypothetical protein